MRFEEVTLEGEHVRLEPLSDVHRGEFLTDFLNNTSRNAILRLGAKEEGILRNHMKMPDGRVRDTVIFSIIKNEWIGVRQKFVL